MSDERWSSDQSIRRNSLHTFIDEKGQVYTITNAPPIINIVSDEDAEFLTNFNLGAILRPRMTANNFPELPFVLSRDPVGDPLLARLCVDPAKLEPIQYPRGWALADDIRNTWIRLEKGLLDVSDRLLTFTERSPCGTAASYVIRTQDHWCPPEDYGYRKPYQSSHAAKISIVRSHMAFRLLVARCSLAVSLWLFPGAKDGIVPPVVTAHYDAKANSPVPDWIAFLKQERVPESWIDAIRDSIITDFSINLRVGAVIEPRTCKWLAMLPVLRAAKIPIFVMWRNTSEILGCGMALPFMKVFAPRSPQEYYFAKQHPPHGKPRTVVLCRYNETRSVPDYSAYDNNTPPFGPYQQPGESVSAFLTRRERYRSDQARQETQTQIEQRQLCMAHANTGLPPFRRTRVYLWICAQIVYPDLPFRWHDYEDRFPIPPSAYRSLWLIHPTDYKKYNPYYDEWDLWFPEGWGEQWSDVADSDVGLRPSKTMPPVPVAPAQRRDGTQVLAGTLSGEQDLLIPDPQDRKIRQLSFPSNYHMHAWYGLWVTGTHAYAGVDYTAFERRQSLLFAQRPEEFPGDEAVKKCIAGWTWAITQRHPDSPALLRTWDLHPEHPCYLLRDAETDPRTLISMDQYHAPVRQVNLDNIGRWVQVTYQNDPETPEWCLFTTAMGALFLVRRIEEAHTNTDALLLLVKVGIPCRTALLLDAPPTHPRNPPPTLVQPLRFPYRKKGVRPTLKDYDAYCQHVLELSWRPHARAAWLKGGIVWHIMMEVTGGFGGVNGDMTFEDQVAQGPSPAIDHYEALTMEREKTSSSGLDPPLSEPQKEAFYDDELSVAELDTISGVVRVFTGNNYISTAGAITNVFDCRHRGSDRGGVVVAEASCVDQGIFIHRHLDLFG